MSVIPITLFFSLLLAGTFVVLFARGQRRRLGSAERDSLLPLAEEMPQEVGGARAPRGLNLRGAQVPPQAHDHDHEDEACGCRSGVRTPCPGCLSRRDAQDPTYF